MRQFDVFPNPCADNRERFPYLIVLQSDLLERLGNVVVAPLRSTRYEAAIPISRLNPVVEVNGEPCFIRIQDLAAIPVRHLQTPVANLSIQRDDIVAALDVLFTGL
jgi:toxin CcdB